MTGEDPKTAFYNQRRAHGNLIRKLGRTLGRGAATLGQELVDHYDFREGGVCVKSIPWLAHKLGDLHVNTVRNHLYELRDVGLISIEERQGQASAISFHLPAIETVTMKAKERKKRLSEERSAPFKKEAGTPPKNVGVTPTKNGGVEEREPLQETGGEPLHSHGDVGVIYKVDKVEAGAGLMAGPQPPSPTTTAEPYDLPCPSSSETDISILDTDGDPDREMAPCRVDPEELRPFAPLSRAEPHDRVRRGPPPPSESDINDLDPFAVDSAEMSIDAPPAPKLPDNREALAGYSREYIAEVFREIEMKRDWEMPSREQAFKNFVQALAMYPPTYFLEKLDDPRFADVNYFGSFIVWALEDEVA